jgi:poly[(R)-3-hydroxyalkanoate] polymerase subunit PhaE
LDLKTKQNYSHSLAGYTWNIDKEQSMTESTTQGNEFGKLVESWMEISKGFWQDFGAKQGDSFDVSGLNFDFFKGADDGGDEDKYKTYRTWEASVNNFSSFLKIMAAPKNQEELSKGVIAFAEAVTQLTGESLENFTDFQSQMVKSFAKVGEHTKAYTLDDLNHSAFESFRDLYRSEFQKYLNIPKIGLPREFHERLSQLTDKYNLFYSHLIELFYFFSLPFEKTNRTMQKRIQEMLERGEIAEDPKETYGEWIKTLEKNFMEMLKSSEYTEVLNNTIISLADCKNVKRDVVAIFLKDLQIPTSTEMDDVYKTLYQMKKKIRELSKQVETLQNAVNNG